MASITTLVDRVKISVLSNGTGPFELGPPATAYRGSEALIDGATYNYATEYNAQYEVGTGVYVLASNTLVRTPVLSSNGGAAVSFPANVVLSFGLSATDVTTGGSLPIVQTIGTGTAVAMSQNATTTELAAKYDAVNPAGYVDSAGALASAVGSGGSQAPSNDTLAATGGAALIGSDDGASGSLWTTIAGFITYLRSSAGSSIVGFLQAGTGAEASAIQTELRYFVRPEQFGAAGDGVTDDAAALQAALDTEKLVRLSPEKTYAFGSQIAVTGDNGGLIGGGKLLMLTGAGQFDASDYTGGYLSNRTGILIDGVDKPVLDVVVEMQTNAGIRTCNALTILSCTNPDVKIEAFGFKEAKYGIIEANSNIGGTIDTNVHDCGADTTSLPSMQVTGCAVDGNRVASVNSTGQTIIGNFKDIRLGATAGAFYGEQTDGLTIQTTGYSGARVTVNAENVGEPFDCFGDFVIADVIAKDAVNYGVKLIHGASFCKVNATVDGCGIYGVVIGSDSTTKSCNRNFITATVDGVGTVTNPIPPSTTAAFATDGSSARYQPTNNTVIINGRTNGATADYAVLVESGSGNMIDADCTLSFNLQYGVVNSLSGSVTTTSGSPNLTAVAASLVGLVAGQYVTGIGIPALTYLVSVDPDTSTAVMSANATASGTITMTAKLRGNIIRRKTNTHIRAYMGTATTVESNTTIAFDTQVYDPTNEYDPSTGIATVRCDGRYKVRAQLRYTSIASLSTAGLAITKNSDHNARMLPINPAESSREVWAAAECILECSAGDTIKGTALSSDAGALTVTNLADYTFIEIEQI